MSALIVDFPAQARRSSAVSSKKTMVHFSNEYDIRFYERPDKVHASELHYSRDDMKQFKLANRQAILDIYKRHLSLTNGSTEDDAKVVFQGCELTGMENLLTPGQTKKSMARKRGCWDAVLDEQEKQDASGLYDPDRLARASQEYSRWATRRSLKVGLMQHVSSL